MSPNYEKLPVGESNPGLPRDRRRYLSTILTRTAGGKKHIFTDERRHSNVSSLYSLSLVLSNSLHVVILIGYGCNVFLPLVPGVGGASSPKKGNASRWR